jgi:hypothetical protein
MNILNENNKEPVDIQPMSFPPQCIIITDFGSPKQLIIL